MKQDLPTPNMNVDETDEDELLDILDGVDLIYVYPHHRIKLENNEFQQTRSGPNWEGGITTMTTCKHFLRTYKTIEPKKVALCGITNKLNNENYLLYVGVIDKVFLSNYELGLYLRSNNSKAYNKKLATKNPLGDIFESLYGLDLNMQEQYDSFNFVEPEGHCRYTENDSNGERKWLKDIEYETKHGAIPKCLILDPIAIHVHPNLVFTGKLGRSGIVLKGEDAPEQLLKLLDEPL